MALLKFAINGFIHSCKKLFQFKNTLYSLENAFNQPPRLESENKWLNPKDNFGVMKRGKAWSKD